MKLEEYELLNSFPAGSKPCFRYGSPDYNFFRVDIGNNNINLEILYEDKTRQKIHYVGLVMVDNVGVRKFALIDIKKRRCEWYQTDCLEGVAPYSFVHEILNAMIELGCQDFVKYLLDNEVLGEIGSV